MSEPLLPPEPAKDASIDDIELDIAVTRERLAKAIGALGENLDVPLQAKRKVDETKADVIDRVGQVKAQAADKFTQLNRRAGQNKGKAAVRIMKLAERTRQDPRAAVPLAGGTVAALALLIWSRVRRRSDI